MDIILILLLASYSRTMKLLRVIFSFVLLRIMLINKKASTEAIKGSEMERCSKNARDFYWYKDEPCTALSRSSFVIVRDT